MEIMHQHVFTCQSNEQFVNNPDLNCCEPKTLLCGDDPTSNNCNTNQTFNAQANLGSCCECPSSLPSCGLATGVPCCPTGKTFNGVLSDNCCGEIPKTACELSTEVCTSPLIKDNTSDDITNCCKCKDECGGLTADCVTCVAPYIYIATVKTGTTLCCGCPSIECTVTQDPTKDKCVKCLATQYFLPTETSCCKDYQCTDTQFTCTGFYEPIATPLYPLCCQCLRKDNPNRKVCDSTNNLQYDESGISNQCCKCLEACDPNNAAQENCTRCSSDEVYDSSALNTKCCIPKTCKNSRSLLEPNCTATGTAPNTLVYNENNTYVSGKDYSCCDCLPKAEIICKQGASYLSSNKPLCCACHPVTSTNICGTTGVLTGSTDPTACCKCNECQNGGPATAFPECKCCKDSSGADLICPGGKISANCTCECVEKNDADCGGVGNTFVGQYPKCCKCDLLTTTCNDNGSPVDNWPQCCGCNKEITDCGRDGEFFDNYPQCCKCKRNIWCGKSGLFVDNFPQCCKCNEPLVTFYGLCKPDGKFKDNFPQCCECDEANSKCNSNGLFTNNFPRCCKCNPSSPKNNCGAIGVFSDQYPRCCVCDILQAANCGENGEFSPSSFPNCCKCKSDIRCGRNAERTGILPNCCKCNDKCPDGIYVPFGSPPNCKCCDERTFSCTDSNGVVNGIPYGQYGESPNGCKCKCKNLCPDGSEPTDYPDCKCKCKMCPDGEIPPMDTWPQCPCSGCKNCCAKEKDDGLWYDRGIRAVKCSSQEI